MLGDFHTWGVIITIHRFFFFAYDAQINSLLLVFWRNDQHWFCTESVLYRFYLFTLFSATVEFSLLSSSGRVRGREGSEALFHHGTGRWLKPRAQLRRDPYRTHISKSGGRRAWRSCCWEEEKRPPWNPHPAVSSEHGSLVLLSGRDSARHQVQSARGFSKLRQSKQCSLCCLFLLFFRMLHWTWKAVVFFSHLKRMQVRPGTRGACKYGNQVTRCSFHSHSVYPQWWHEGGREPNNDGRYTGCVIVTNVWQWEFSANKLNGWADSKRSLIAFSPQPSRFAAAYDGSRHTAQWHVAVPRQHRNIPPQFKWLHLKNSSSTNGTITTWGVCDLLFFPAWQSAECSAKTWEPTVLYLAA